MKTRSFGQHEREHFGSSTSLAILELQEGSSHRHSLPSATATATKGYQYLRRRLSILDGKISVPAYHKSKTLAEKAAWDFNERGGGDLELTVINPTGIFGPILSSHFSSSIQIIQAMMSGKTPGCPQLSFWDGRCVADLHMWGRGRQLTVVGTPAPSCRCHRGA
jgi:hypothetical protein